MENKEKTLVQLDAARLKVKQYENKIQLLENRKRHLEKKPTASARTIFAIWAAPSKAFPKRQTP